MAVAFQVGSYWKHTPASQSCSHGVRAVSTKMSKEANPGRSGRNVLTSPKGTRCDGVAGVMLVWELRKIELPAALATHNRQCATGKAAIINVPLVRVAMWTSIATGMKVSKALRTNSTPPTLQCAQDARQGAVRLIVCSAGFWTWVKSWFPPFYLPTPLFCNGNVYHGSVSALCR